MKITEDQLRKKIIVNKIRRVNHHTCGICEEWVGYDLDVDVTSGCIDVYYDSSCGCASSQPQIRPMEDLLGFLNSNSDSAMFRARLKEIFE